jgi:hypothetical protein
MPRPELRLVPGPDDEVDAITLTGRKAEVDEIVAAHDLMKTMERRIDERRLIIEPLAAQARCRAEITRHTFSKKVCVLGSARNVNFTWTNMFRDIGPRSIKPVQKALGSFFKSFFTLKTTYSIDADKIPELKLLLGKKFSEFVTETTVAETNPDFRERRFHLLHAMSKDQKKALDDVMEQLAFRPQMRIG